MSYNAPDLETAEGELRVGLAVSPEQTQLTQEQVADWCAFVASKGATIEEWEPGPQVSAGYTVNFPDGHILILAYMEKIQRWLSESQGMPTTWERRRARPSPNNERAV